MTPGEAATCALRVGSECSAIPFRLIPACLIARRAGGPRPEHLAHLSRDRRLRAAYAPTDDPAGMVPELIDQFLREL